MSEINRLRWRCRRGMLELDLVLGEFLEERYIGLPAHQQAAFAALLACSDQELWDMLYGKLSPNDARSMDVLAMLRQ